MDKMGKILDLLSTGIRAEGLRQQAITNNVANLETPGYRRMDVNFEHLLTEALEKPGAVDPSQVQPQLYHPQKTPLNNKGNDVQWEQEVGEMVKNTLRHKAYVRLLHTKLLQMESAMNVKL